MDTAGKAVLLSGATVLVSLSAVMLVPSPSFRSMAGGIMLAVVFVLAATLTLLPAVLAGSTSASTGSPAVGPHRRAPLAAVRRLGRAALAPPGRLRAWPPLVVLLALAAPVIGLRTAMPSIKVLPEDASARVGYDTGPAGLRPGRPGTLQVVADAGQADAGRRRPDDDPGIAAVMPAQPAADGCGWC